VIIGSDQRLIVGERYWCLRDQFNRLYSNKPLMIESVSSEDDWKEQLLASEKTDPMILWRPQYFYEASEASRTSRML
jgi:hypothetical protein